MPTCLSTMTQVVLLEMHMLHVTELCFSRITETRRLELRLRYNPMTWSNVIDFFEFLSLNNSYLVVNCFTILLR